MRVLVTGATGFIGTHLIDRLTADGHGITALVRNPDAAPQLRTKGVLVVAGDVTDAGSVERAMTGAEVVLHLARAKAHGARPTEMFTVNVEGSRNVARAARKARVARLVHCSSSAVYGSRVGLVSEATKLRPDSGYARSKRDAEQEVLRECGDIAVVARITAVMGPGCLSWRPLFRSAAAGKLGVAGDGANMHHPADVADIVEGLIRCATTENRGGRTYNLAGPEPIRFSELREVMAAAVTTAPVRHRKSYSRTALNLYYQAGRMSDVLFGLRPPLFESVAFITADRVLDLSRSRDEIGYVPAIGVTEAARRTAAWLREEKLL